MNEKREVNKPFEGELAIAGEQDMGGREEQYFDNQGMKVGVSHGTKNHEGAKASSTCSLVTWPLFGK